MLELLRGCTGRAVVIVTHEEQAAAIADRVLQLEAGRLGDGVGAAGALRMSSLCARRCCRLARDERSPAPRAS